MNLHPENPSSHFVRLRQLATLATTAIAAIAFGAEQLDRGVAAFPNPDGHVYVGWRLLASDLPDVAFDVFRSDPVSGSRQKLTAKPVTTSTNFVDRDVRAGGGKGMNRQDR